MDWNSKWRLVTNFEQINRSDIKVLWDGINPVSYKVIQRAFTPTVMLHGEVSLPGETVHWDGDNGHNGKPDGWNVWLRRDYHGKCDDGQEPFDDDTTREKDFANDDYDGALAYAQKLAAELQCEVEEY